MFPRYLVFSGGGLHGLCFVGALLAMREQLSEVRGCVGTSIGALVALAVCTGLSPERIRTFVTERIEWSRVHAGVNMHALVERFGLETRAGLEYLVELVLAEAGLSAGVTLRTAHALTHRHFCCCVTDLTHSRLLYLDHLSAPDMPVRDAVVASMCLPLLFEPMRLGDALCVDGGLLDNMPVHFFDPSQSLVFYFARTAPARTVENWRDYALAVMQCGHEAKQERDIIALAGRTWGTVAIEVPAHAPSSLALHDMHTRAAQLLMTIGYLQAACEDLRVTAGRMVAMVAALNNSMPEGP